MPDVMVRRRRPLKVVVAGGGFAAAETLLALRALAEERVELELITPDPRLVMRPAAPGEAFGAAHMEVYDLARLAADVDARLRVDTVEAVAPRARRLRLASGAHVQYDALVLALGARRRAAVAGALTYRDQRDNHHVARVRAQLRAGALRTVAFAAPSGVSWTLPLYELALLAAAEVEELALRAQVIVATPERAPLEVLGPEAARAVGALLAERDVRLVRDAHPRMVHRRSLELTWGGRLAADAVLALPRLTGRPLPGVPAGWNGFVRTDDQGRVEELDDVFAVGDMTDFPIKQGGLATQQADAAAAALAARAGAAADAPAPRRVLRASLFGGHAPLYLRAELDAKGRPIAGAASSTIGEEPLWWPSAKLFGRYLTPWMAAQAAPTTARVS